MQAELLAPARRAHGARLSLLQSLGNEMDYSGVLNRLLPTDIRVLAWAPIDADFSARRSCVWREYKFFFFRDAMDLGRVREAAALLVGKHDFRNFCKMDAVNVHSFEREILRIAVDPADSLVAAPVTQEPFVAAAAEAKGAERCDRLYVLTVRGTAFLWHQIRCIASILFAVGRGEESPSLVRDLLDTERHPAKPDYPLAADQPLVLYACDFGEKLEWRVRFSCCQAASPPPPPPLPQLIRHPSALQFSRTVLERIVSDLHASWRKSLIEVGWPRSWCSCALSSICRLVSRR
jgi:tRNA pseudouridine(38-40) synthase